MKIENITEAITTLDGAMGLLMFISCLYDVPEGSIPTSEYSAPAFALLSDLTRNAADFLSEKEPIITQALKAEAKEKPAGKTCEAPDGHKTTTHNG